MKKFLSILCATVLLCVAVCALVACGLKEVDIDRLLKKCDAHDEISLGDLSGFEILNVNIESDSYSIYVHEVEYGRSITLDYINNPSDKIDATPSDNASTKAVTVNESDSATSANKNRFLIVGIPEYLLNRQSSLELNITITSQYGNVQVEDIEYAHAVAVAAEKGTVYISDGHAELTTVLTKEGDVYVETEGDEVRVTTQSGNAEFDLTVKEITIITDSGDIKGTLEHPQYWYTINAHSDKGKCNLDRREGSGEYLLTLTSVKGDIKVRFDND